jgi:hypothetical protein
LVGLSIINELEFYTKAGAEPNPNFTDSDAWTCIITLDDRSISVPFYMGKGHKGKAPEMLDVLDCLFMDARAKDETFESWCGESGYDPDSISALNTFKTCQRLGEQLEHLFGSDYEEAEEEVYDLINE